MMTKAQLLPKRLIMKIELLLLNWEKGKKLRLLRSYWKLLNCRGRLRKSVLL